MYKLEFSMQELQIIAAALRELPYKQVAELLQNIDRQMQTQLTKEPE